LTGLVTCVKYYAARQHCLKTPIVDWISNMC